MASSTRMNRPRSRVYPRGMSLRVGVWMLVTLGCVSEAPVDAGADAPTPDVPSALDAPSIDGPSMDAGDHDTPSIDAPDAVAAADGVACGLATCTPGDVCCWSEPGGRADCSAASACAWTVLACDGPEDCSGGVCCAQADGGSACAPEAECLARVCHSDGDCGGAVCCPSFGPLSSFCAARCP